MNDVNKLSEIISSLEDQAKKVSEFNGLLSAVNDARIQIDASKDLLGDISVGSRQLLFDNKSQFDQLELLLRRFDEKFVRIEEVQNLIFDHLKSLDTLPLKDFLSASKTSEALILNRLDRIEGKFDLLLNVIAEKAKDKNTLIDILKRPFSKS